MFVCDYKKLRLSFNEFHDMEGDDEPEDDEFCLLELKDGSHTAGKWMEGDKESSIPGEFIRGTADSLSIEEIAKWHSLERYDLTNCLEDEKVNYVNLGVEKEGAYSVIIKDFKSISDGDFPKKEQYCLLIFKNGRIAAGRWYKWRGEKGGTFIYASALASYDMEDVWAWTPLSPDSFFEREEESERERLHEEELNRNPSADPEKFKYGTDVEVYYDKALKRLREEYSWATKAQMKKATPWEIVPLHGRYVFARVGNHVDGTRNVNEWTEGSSADEFIDFLYEYTKKFVQNSNPDQKFKYGMEIEKYLEKAYENVKKDYRWLDKSMIEQNYHYEIRKVDGDWEFTIHYKGSKNFSVCDYPTAERFIESVEHNYQNDALSANPVVAEYHVPFGHVELHGWYLEKYVVSKLQSGDYKVYAQAGDRVTGGGREFFITPQCFEAPTYEEFLDRYQEIIPGSSFGMSKEDLLPNEELKSFFGYDKREGGGGGCISS